MSILIGTKDGVYDQWGEGWHLEGSEVSALVAGDGCVLAIVDGTTIWKASAAQSYHDWAPVASIDAESARCVLPSTIGLLVGTSDARLMLQRADGEHLVGIESFDRVDGRERWWQAPGLDLQPNTRSLAEAPDGTLYVNVHVGGIYRSRDGGASWEPTIDQETDVHEIRAFADGLVVAATGMAGLCISRDTGETWESTTEGFPPGGWGLPYARAVVVCDDMVVLTGSNGAMTDDAGVYRKPLDSSGPVERCTAGLPDRFAENINSGCLGAGSGFVAFGTTEGAVFSSADTGATWEQLCADLPAVLCVVVT